jgi:hypothetical protein
MRCSAPVANLDARQKRSGMTVEQLQFRKTFVNAFNDPPINNQQSTINNQQSAIGNRHSTIGTHLELK